MATMPPDPQPPLPPAVLDELLFRTPVDVLLFDTALICRYAAPAADQFLGRSREQLLGRPVGEVLPPATNGLRGVLEHAVREATTWQEARYRFSCPVNGVETAFCLTVRVES